MADLRGAYDPNATPDTGIAVLPAGPYSVKITNGEWKETKSGMGKFLQIEMAVVEGEYQGSVIVDRFNLVNPNAQAVAIANSQFAALREAVGVRDPKDTADLCNIRFQLLLKCEKRNDDPSKMTNVVQRYIKRGQTINTPQQNPSNPPHSRNAPNPGATPSPAPEDTPPW